MAQNEQLIRLEHAICVATDACFTSGMSEHDVALLSTVRKKLRALPTVDAVPVVRCKDCKDWIAEEPERCKAMNAKPYGYCNRFNKFPEQADWQDIRSQDDFCAYGERKGNE